MQPINISKLVVQVRKIDRRLKAFHAVASEASSASQQDPGGHSEATATAERQKVRQNCKHADWAVLQFLADVMRESIREPLASGQPFER